MDEALLRMGRAPWADQEKCYGLLLKVLQNPIAQPGEAKFRTLKTSANALKTKVLNVDGALEFLLSSGFTQDGETLTLADLEACTQAHAAVQAFATKARDDEFRRQRDADIAARKAAEKNVNHLKCAKPVVSDPETLAKLELDRKELEADRAHRPVQASKAVLTKFGMNGMKTAQETNAQGG